jgi:uncharacterized membrane protein
VETSLKKANKKTLATVVVTSFFVLFGTLFFIKVHAATTTSQPGQPTEDDTFYKGEVLSVLSEETKEEYGQSSVIQQVKIRVVQGMVAGKEVTVPFEMDASRAQYQRLEKGDYVVVGRMVQLPEPLYYISDVYRLNSLWWMVGLFIVVTIVCARWKGVRAFIGLGISFLIIAFFIVPRVVAGSNPLTISLVGTIIIAGVALYVAHGFQARSHLALLSTIISIGLSFGLAALFVHIGKLFGLGTEEAFLLQSVPDVVINLRGLLLGGIILGTLGVLDDITTSQAAAVEELHKANTSFGFWDLYSRASSVGREHIASLVNTLALAYTGASFPLLLLFKIYERPLWVTLNSELIFEEVVRTMVGSISLVVAVPLTTFVAAAYFSRHKI